MRHKLPGRQPSSNSPNRHALMRNLAGSLVPHEPIHTTLPKAKELRRVVEPLITLGKRDSESNRRLAFSRLRDSAIVTKLFGDLGPRFRARPGGYTRILRMMPRPGDSAPMALMQLVDGPVAEAAVAPVAAPAAEAKPPHATKAPKPATAEAAPARTGPEVGPTQAKPAKKPKKASAKTAGKRAAKKKPKK